MKRAVVEMPARQILTFDTLTDAKNAIQWRPMIAPVPNILRRVVLSILKVFFMKRMMSARVIEAKSVR